MTNKQLYKILKELEAHMIFIGKGIHSHSFVKSNYGASMALIKILLENITNEDSSLTRGDVVNIARSVYHTEHNRKFNEFRG